MGSAARSADAVDGALALKARGWSVEFVVNFFDPDRTQPEVRSGEIKVTVLPGLPERWARGRFRVLLAVAGQRRLLERLRRRTPEPDLIVCDLVPHAAGWIRRRLPERGSWFICHFPDRLAVSARGPYGLYRALIGRWEDRGMRAADRVVVNSALHRGGGAPGLSLSGSGPPRRSFLRARLPLRRPVRAMAAPAPGPRRSFLSVARFDPAKAWTSGDRGLRGLPGPGRRGGVFPLAPGAGWRVRPPSARGAGAAGAPARAGDGPRRFSPGGLAVRSQSGRVEALWAEAFALVHAAPSEHFGIVLIEAMARGLPVLAVGRRRPDGNRAGSRE